MLDFQQKRRLRSFMYNRVTLIILGIIVILTIHSTWVVYEKQQESAEFRKTAEQKVSDFSARENDLQANIASLKTDQGVEQEIRTKFSVARPDENVIIILDDGSATTSATTSKTIWQKFLDLFR